LKRLKLLKGDPRLEGLFATTTSYYFGDEMLDSILARFPDGSTVVEFGGGESTLALAKHYNVYCVEDKEKYLNLSQDVNYIHAPLKQYHDKALGSNPQWYDRDVLRAKLPDEYDFIILDGPETDSAYGRYGAARYKTLLKNDVPILIDDLQQPSIYIVALMLARYKGLDSFEINVTKDNRVYAWLG
jgi:hypothetical protein